MASFDKERKRILLVEDHEDTWELMEYCLTEYKLVCARDFDEGLRLAHQRYFDLYILDNWLPGGFGVELCRLIRKFDPNTPILFYSAAGYTRDVQEGLGAGAQAYLVKPVSFDELEQAVARLISVVVKRDFEARRAELAAIREELDIRQMENAERMEKAKKGYLRSAEKALRLKAEMAFLAAGGARGEFARQWPTVLVEEVRNHRDGGEQGAAV
jgi:DNA-binding response OmpR family regulator